MNKFLFSCSTMMGDYGFYASWNNDVVDYEIEDNLFEKKNYGYLYPVLKPFSLDYIGPRKPVLKGALDKETSRKFIELIEKAKIYEMDEKIKKQQEAYEDPFYCTDLPSYRVSYLNRCWIDDVYWYDGDFGSKVEEQKYIFMALLLCDSDAFDFLRWEMEDQYQDKPFVGEIKNLYYSNDNTIQYVSSNQKKQLYENIDEFKNKLANLYAKGNPFKEDEIERVDAEVMLINENDEIFYYYGDNGKNNEFDAVVKYAAEFVHPITTDRGI